MHHSSRGDRASLSDGPDVSGRCCTHDGSAITYMVSCMLASWYEKIVDDIAPYDVVYHAPVDKQKQ